jgi:hypothetical protein
VNYDIVHGHGVTGKNSNILDLNGKELNVILWTMMKSSLQKVVWLYVTHRKQFLMIGLGRTMLDFASCIVPQLCQQ